MKTFPACITVLSFGLVVGCAIRSEEETSTSEAALTELSPQYDVVLTPRASVTPIGPPVIAADGTAYVMLKNFREGTVQAVLPDGALGWSSAPFPLDTNSGYALGLDDDGNVYAQEIECVTSPSNSLDSLCTGALLSFTPAGALRWRTVLYEDRSTHDSGSWAFLGLGGPRFDPISKNVYARDHSLTAVTQAGVVLWSVDDTHPNAIDIDSSGDVVFAGASSLGFKHWIEKRSPDGVVKWSTRSEDGTLPGIDALGFRADGTLVAAGYDRIGFIPSTDSTPTASFTLPFAVSSSGGIESGLFALANNGSAAVFGNTVYAVNASGALAWSYPGVTASGVAPLQGGVVVQSRSGGKICALSGVGEERACFTPPHVAPRLEVIGRGVGTSANAVFALTRGMDSALHLTKLRALP